MIAGLQLGAESEASAFSRRELRSCRLVLTCDGSARPPRHPLMPGRAEALRRAVAALMEPAVGLRIPRPVPHLSSWAKGGGAR